MALHKLKCWPGPFLDIAEGRKTVEVRRCDDRYFEVQDVLELREWTPGRRVDPDRGYSGRWAEVRVVGITEHAGSLRLRGVTVDGLVYPLVALSIVLLRTGP